MRSFLILLTSVFILEGCELLLSKGCNKILRNVHFQICSSSSDSVTLDSIRIVTSVQNTDIEAIEKLENPIHITCDQSFFLVNDSDMDQISKKGTEFTIKAWLDSALLIDTLLLIGKNECHVHLILGPEKIYID